MEVIKEFDFVPDIISIVHHGVFIPKIRISKKEFLQKNKYVILQFGLQTYYKGTDILVDAVNLLPAEYSEKIETRIENLEKHIKYIEIQELLESFG